MAEILQITDKGAAGGGIRRCVDIYAAMIREWGWTPREVMLDHDLGAGRGGALSVRALHRRDASELREIAERCEASDLVHLHLGFTAVNDTVIDLMSARAPLVVSLHDVSPFHYLGTKPRHAAGSAGLGPSPSWPGRVIHGPARRRLWAKLCQKAAIVLAPSHFLKGLAQASGVQADQIVHLPHPVDFLDVAVSNIAETPPVGVYAGHMSNGKGAVDAAQAVLLSKHPESKLIMIGDGPARREIATRLERAGQPSRVQLLGQQPQDVVTRNIAAARFLVHPSRIPEGLGFVGLEAMGLGRPVVGYGLGGSADWLIDNTTGLIAAPTTVSALALRMDQLFEDPGLAVRLGTAARSHVAANFHLQAIKGKLFDIYERVFGAATS